MNSNTLADAAAALARVGWRVLPVAAGGKRPLLARWQHEASAAPSAVAAWWNATPAANVGILTGHQGVFVLDVDVADGKPGAESLATLIATHGALPETLEARTASGGRHLYFVSTEAIRNSAGKLGVGLDIRGASGFVVAPPSITPAGAYTWVNLVQVAAAPVWLVELARSAAPTPESSTPTPATVEATPELLADLRSALTAIPADSRDEWVSVGCALRELGEAGRDLWLSWSAKSEKHDPETDPHAWETLGHDSTGVAAVFAKAARLGWANPRARDASAVFGHNSAPGMVDGAHNPCSHLANGYRIVRKWGGELLHVEGIGWHVWSPPWRHDEQAARRRVHGLGQLIAGEAGAMGPWVAAATDRLERESRQKQQAQRWKWAGASEQGATLDGSLREAASLLSTRAEDLDADPDLLGLPGGVLDLRNGARRPYSPDDRISKVAGCDFEASAPAPTWEQFLVETFGDADLIDYVQRLAGYALCGRRGEHLLPIAYGSGANGKSTFLGALSAVLGDYAAAGSPGLLIANAEQHPSALADLHGRRLVVVSETGEYGRLNEERVKAITGGDPIKARRLYREPFEFTPTHLLILQTNHRPRIGGTDEGIWRRIRLIPFTRTVPAERRDPDLPDKLRAELPGILAWCVRGLHAYRERGLRDAPGAVMAATDEYRSNSDVIGEWLAECCVEVRGSTVTAAELYASYSSWCARNGERAQSQRMLGLRLAERGFQREKGRDGWRWLGLKISGTGLYALPGRTPAEIFGKA